MQGVFDLDGSGSIDRNEFLARMVADTIIATLAHRGSTIGKQAQRLRTMLEVGQRRFSAA